MISDERLEELARIAAEASPGMWVSFNPTGNFDVGRVVVSSEKGSTLFYSTHHGKMRDDTCYVAAFNPQVGAELVAEVKALRERVFDLARKLVDKDPAAQATREYLRDK